MFIEEKNKEKALKKDDIFQKFNNKDFPTL
jgi:hypothetical protein